MEFTIENEVLRVKVQSKGAELCSVVKKETGEEMLWQADPEVWGRHAPILFPYCGRLKNGTFTHKDVVYEGGQHGFARDFEHALVEQGSDFVTLCLEANVRTMEKYPFAFKLFTTYRIEGNVLRHEIRIENDSNEEMPFSFGYHPAFLCPFDAQHKPEDYVLRFDEPETPEVVVTGEDDGLVTGEHYTYFENGTEIPVHDGMFDHDSVCFKNLKSKTFSIVEKETGRSVSVNIEKFPYVLMWSAKGAIRYLCIEPWHGLPDARTSNGVWLEKPDTIHLAPEDQWETSLTVTFAR